MSGPGNVAARCRQDLQQALACYRDGRLDDMAALCRKVLQSLPREPNALHLLGVAHLLSGRVDEAVAALGRAAKADKRNAEIVNNLATAYRRQGSFDAAVDAGRKAVKLTPKSAPAHHNLGRALELRGDREAATRSFLAALKADPRYLEARRAAADALRLEGRLEDSLTHYDAAAKAAPDHAETHNARGVVLAELARFEDAIAAFRRAIAIAPDFGDAQVNIANALCGIQAAEEAVPHFEKALQLDPGCADTLGNLGHAYRQLDRLDAAEEAYRRALEIDPDNIEAHVGAAIADLTQGKYGSGWRHYLCRDSMRGVGPEIHRQPLAQDLSGMRLLVLPDQGIGDEIFFLRFAADIRGRGATFAYRPDPRLAAMLERAAIADRIVPADESPSGYDLVLSVGDLAYLAGMSDGEAPPPSIRIPPLAEWSERHRSRLAELGPPPYVGVTWRGGTPNRKRMLFKEAPIDEMAAALRSAEGTFLALQRNPGDGEIDAFAAALGRPLHDLSGVNDDLEEVLALVAAIDAYVCVSNSNVHLREAAGRSSHVLLPNPPEFRWMAAGDESPWFPGTVIYRQDKKGGWAPAMAALKGDMARLPA
jgi:tetratricopeptide (TPR) repeat protein